MTPNVNAKRGVKGAFILGSPCVKREPVNASALYSGGIAALMMSSALPYQIASAYDLERGHDDVLESWSQVY